MKPFTPKTWNDYILTAFCGLYVAVLILGLLLPRTIQADPANSPLQISRITLEDFKPSEGAQESSYISSSGYNVGR